MLSSAEQDEFNERGFVLAEKHISAASLEALRKAADSRRVRSAMKEIGGSGHQFNMTRRHSAFAEMARDDGILDGAEAFVGPNIQLHHCKLAVKPVKPGGKVEWHQDFAFAPHTNTDLVSAFIYLDDTTVANGAMTMIEASHRLGPITHRDAAGSFIATCDPPDAPPVLVEARAGQVSFHHCLTVHGSGAQTGGTQRRGLVVWMRASDASQVGGSSFEETGDQLRGSSARFARATLDKIEVP